MVTNKYADKYNVPVCSKRAGIENKLLPC